MSNLSTIFKAPLSGGGLILLLLFPQALNTEFRVDWRGGRAWSACTGVRWSPGRMTSFFNFTCDVSSWHGHITFTLVVCMWVCGFHSSQRGKALQLRNYWETVWEMRKTGTQPSTKPFLKFFLHAVGREAGKLLPSWPTFCTSLTFHNNCVSDSQPLMCFRITWRPNEG